MRLVLALSVVCWSTTTGCSSSQESNDNSSVAEQAEIVEVNVTNQPKLKNGQTAIAINPADHDNLVFTATMHDLMNPEGLTGQFAWGCFVAYSTDRGETWTTTELPYGGTPSCGEPNVAADAEGNFYILFNKLFSFSDDFNERRIATAMNKIGVSRSTDGGRTWSEPVEPPLSIGGQPKLAVDLITGKVYAVGGFKFLFPSGLAVSDDHGKTWSEARLMPEPEGCLELPLPPGVETPCGFPGVQLAVHDGVLATGINRIDEDKIAFYVSRDDGETWSESTLTNSDGDPVAPAGALEPSDPGGGEDPVPWITADETKKNRFAAMVPRERTLEVYVTDDAGKSWEGPATIQAPNKNRPWINFGLDGGLGVMWRTTDVDAFSVYSFDSGRTFSDPVKVNAETHPLADSNSPGDDWSHIHSDGEFVYVAWPDGRNGDTIDGIVARVPIELYK